MIKMKKALLIVVLLIHSTPLFSQNNDLFLKYPPGTSRQNIIANEGYPSYINRHRNYRRYHYRNRNVNGYKVNIEYDFLNDILLVTHHKIIIFRKNEEAYRNVFENIYNYYNENYGQWSIINQGS